MQGAKMTAVSTDLAPLAIHAGHAFLLILRDAKAARYGTWPASSIRVADVSRSTMIGRR
jgi:hypothetical protein